MSDQQKFDWVEYNKFKFAAHWYTALNKHKERKFVLHTNIGLGLLAPYNKQLGEAPFERFYLGGVFLSGFILDGREIVNLRGYDDLSLTSPNQNTGSPAISKYSMELRYPLSTNPSATIFAQAFMDAGRTWSTTQDFNPFNVYRSGGIGLRIFLPMFGLLGFDYGWQYNFAQGHRLFASEAVICDVSGDGQVDILFGTYSPDGSDDHLARLHGLNASGQPLAGFPLPLYSESGASKKGLRAAPTLADLDGDCDVEILAGSQAGVLYVWDLPAPYFPGLMPWPTARHDFQRTGFFNTPANPLHGQNQSVCSLFPTNLYFPLLTNISNNSC